MPSSHSDEHYQYQCKGCRDEYIAALSKTMPEAPQVTDRHFSVQETLNERGSRYGDFTHHAAISQDLQRVMMGVKGWSLLNDVQRQALTVISDKIARILNGDPNYVDNWHDIQGYARLVEERLPKDGN